MSSNDELEERDLIDFKNKSDFRDRVFKYFKMEFIFIIIVILVSNIFIVIANSRR
tara:strand:+ start:562 stop:726 length:165 start_codon:yes stop_codon:yes gene_type:complete